MQKLLMICALVTTVPAFGQAIRFDSNATTVAKNVPTGASANVMTLPNASIFICAYPALGNPCTNTVPIYNDQLTASQITQPLATDALGRFGFWILPGQYSYSIVNQGGANVGNFPLSLTSPAGPPIPFLGIWSSSTTYQQGQAVSFSNQLYISLVGNNLNHQPDTSTAQWTVFNFSLSSLPVSAASYGAVDDNSTDNTTAFAAMEAASNTDFFLPFNNIGIYKTTQIALSKHYWGPGAISLNSVNSTQAGIPSAIGSTRNIGLDEIGYSQNEAAVDLTFIGDSITICYISGVLCDPQFSYPMRIQQAMNARAGGIGQGGYLSGPQMGRLTTTGTTTFGTHGPLASDLLMSSGATASFPAAYVLNVLLSTYNVSGGGTITVSGVAGTWGTVGTGTGSGETKGSGLTSPDGVDYASQTITLSCAGGPCEVTNIVAGTLPTTNKTTNFIQTIANGGYCTSNFTPAAVLNSIAFNVAFKSPVGNSMAVVALGTNDMVNATCAVTPAVFQTNLQAIVTGLKSRGIAPILTVPLHSGPPNTYVPLHGSFEQFRNAVYNVARLNECKVVDLSELDLAAANLLGTDGLHPIADGYGAMAARFSEKLGLGKLASGPLGQFSGPLSIQADPIAASRRVVQFNDLNNINRGNIYAIDGVVSPVATWTLRSFPIEGLGNTYLSSFAGEVHLQTQNRVDRLVINNSTIHATLPFDVGGGASIANTNNVPQVGTPSVNQAACIKAAGPPVVIGYCSTVVSSSGACTCN